MHNESQAERIAEPVVKSSKLQRIKSATITAGIFVIPTAAMVGSIYYSVKVTKMAYETARMNLEAAQLSAGE